jgi:hypothetical protein
VTGHLCGCLFVRFRQLEQPLCLLFVCPRLGHRPLRLPLMLASVAGRGAGFDLALRRLLGVPRRLFLMLRSVLIVLPSSSFSYRNHSRYRGK